MPPGRRSQAFGPSGTKPIRTNFKESKNRSMSTLGPRGVERRVLAMPWRATRLSRRMAIARIEATPPLVAVCAINACSARSSWGVAAGGRLGVGVGVGVGGSLAVGVVFRRSGGGADR